MTRSGAVRWYSPLVDVVRTQRPGVVLAHNAPVVPGMLRDCGHKVVLYVHNELLNSYSRAESGRMLNDVDAIVCVSDWLAEKTAQRLPPRLQSRVRTVANGVDTVQFSPHGGRSERDRLRVMFVGRVIPLKGVDVLLHVLALITDTDLDVDIIGSQGFDSEARLSAYEKTLRGLAVKTPHNVHFRPFTERSVLPELLRSADIFVVPSRWSEASGLTVGEAMATGLPIVASRIGGVPEVLGDAGLLVTPDEPTALAAALSSLIGSRARRLKLSAAARTRAEHHDWSRSWRQLRTVLDEV